MEAAFTLTTLVYSINVALGGSIHEGMTPGLLMLAGPSKHFKTNMALVIASAFLRKFPNGVILCYDSEFGASKKYFAAAGIDPNKVFHTPITDIEVLKHDVMKQMQELKRGDEVLILVDSVGNLASKKEVDDAVDGKSVADMTRAKALKSLWRMVTPHLTLKAIPMVVINHTYKEIGMFPKDIVSGGTGGVYSSNDIWIISRSQEKDAVEGVNGWTFTINIEKSRKVKEKSKIPVKVMYTGGVQLTSGLQDWATEFGFMCSPSKGWYSRVDPETGVIEEKRYRARELNHEWFKPILANPLFDEKIKLKYCLPTTALIGDDPEEFDAGEYDESED